MNIPTTLHTRKCIHCDNQFEVNATQKEHLTCPKCAAGSYPYDYFQSQLNHYKDSGVDVDTSHWLAMRDSIDSYCGCHNAAKCFEFNEYAPHDANCHNKVLQIACLDLNSFLEHKNYHYLSDELQELKAQLESISQNQ